MTKKELLAEYLDASNNFRHFHTIRFVQLPIFTAVTFGLLSIVFSESKIISEHIRLALKVGGIVITAIYWVLQQRAGKYRKYFADRAASLEAKLGFTQYTNRPQDEPFNSRNAIDAFFVFCLGFWILITICL
ncbi:MAG: hypothetical protein WEA61_07640 [Anaerolineales bacterium]